MVPQERSSNAQGRMVLVLRSMPAQQVGILVVGAAAIALSVLARPSPAANPSPRGHEYAVYFSPGPDAAIPWGGYHVTVTGYSDSHAAGKSQKKILSEAWREIFHGHPYHFSKPKDHDGYWFRDATPKDGWRVDFKCPPLDSLGKYLERHGFQRVGSTRHGAYWHVSLYGKNEADAKHKLSRLADHGWRLWLVRHNGEWERID